MTNTNSVVNQTLANVRTMLKRRKSQMNGTEVLEAYTTLFPTSGYMTITFVDMYKTLVLLATGTTAVGVKASF